MNILLGDYVRHKDDTDGHIYRVVSIMDDWIKADPMDGWLKTWSLIEDYVFFAREVVR